MGWGLRGSLKGSQQNLCEANVPRGRRDSALVRDLRPPLPGPGTAGSPAVKWRWFRAALSCVAGARGPSLRHLVLLWRSFLLIRDLDAEAEMSFNFSGNGRRLGRGRVDIRPDDPYVSNCALWGKDEI